jgi:diaminopimelate epimerase
MKVFVADSRPKGYINEKDYHWCDDNDLLMFGQFQLGNGNPSEVAMCGIQSRKFTTHILVKDLKIDKDFYKEIITESVEGAMGCTIDRKGDYEIEMGFSHHFNINDIMNELLEKASSMFWQNAVLALGITYRGFA